MVIKKEEIGAWGCCVKMNKDRHVKTALKDFILTLKQNTTLKLFQTCTSFFVLLNTTEDFCPSSSLSKSITNLAKHQYIFKHFTIYRSSNNNNNNFILA